MSDLLEVRVDGIIKPCRVESINPLTCMEHQSKPSEDGRCREWHRVYSKIKQEEKSVYSD